MNMIRRIMPIGVAAALSLTAVCPAYASSTEFSRTAEEWAKLQDNVLEYSEIADLVHEYNATVNKNQIELNDFRKKYGVTNDEWANKYRELADTLDSAVEEPETEDIMYGMTKMTIITNEKQAKAYREMADDAVEDYQTKYFDYQEIEGGIVSKAQTAMINYYLKQKMLQLDQKQLEVLNNNLDSTLIKRRVDSVTDVDVLQAEESLKNQEKMIQDDMASIESVRQNLQVLLGWKHDDQPEIRQLPDLDMERIEVLNPEEDKKLAIENNYKMKSNRKKYENALTNTKKDNLARTIRESEQAIGTRVAAAYQDILAKKAAYELSQAQAELDDHNLRISERQYELGNVSKNANQAQRITAEKSKINVEIAKLNLFQSLQAYDTLISGVDG